MGTRRRSGLTTGAGHNKEMKQPYKINPSIKRTVPQVLLFGHKRVNSAITLSSILDSPLLLVDLRRCHHCPVLLCVVVELHRRRWQLGDMRHGLREECVGRRIIQGIV